MAEKIFAIAIKLLNTLVKICYINKMSQEIYCNSCWTIELTITFLFGACGR